MKSFSGLICYGVFPLGLDQICFHFLRSVPLFKELYSRGLIFINILSSEKTTKFKENIGIGTPIKRVISKIKLICIFQKHAGNSECVSIAQI